MKRFLSFLALSPQCSNSDIRIKRALLFNRTMSPDLQIFFRLNIPPFVPARTVLEGLESEDLCENEKPVKHEISGTKVKRKQTTGAPVSHHQTITPECFLFCFFSCLTMPFCLMFTRLQTELNRKKWKRKRLTCSGCVTQFQWRWWAWVGFNRLPCGLLLTKLKGFILRDNPMCPTCQAEKATTQRKQTTLRLRGGCGATMWMEWNLSVTTMEEQCGSKYDKEKSNILKW